MRTLFVVLLPPRLDFLPCVSQVQKPGRVQTFVPEAPVEALHMPVLDGFSGLNMNHRDAPLFAPLLEIQAGELRTVVAPNGARRTTFCNNPLEHARHLPAGDARINFDGQRFFRVAVDQRERSQRSPCSQSIGNKVHGPFLVWPHQQSVHRYAARQSLSLEPPYHQALSFVEPVDALHIHLPPLPHQQRPQPAVAIPGVLPRHGQQRLTELRVSIRPRLIPVRRAVHFQELASVALAERMLGHYQRHVPPGAHKLQPFFRMTVVSASLSRLRSATKPLSRRFSSSSAFRRLASLTSMPPNFDFQLYRVWSVTPMSRATSFTDRPPSICFTAPMIFSSLCFVFFI